MTRIGESQTPPASAVHIGAPHHAPTRHRRRHAAHHVDTLHPTHRSAHLHVAANVRPTPRAPARHVAPRRLPAAPPPPPAHGPGQIPGPPLPSGPVHTRRIPGLDTPPAIDAPARHGPPSRILFVGDSHTPEIAREARAAAHDRLGGLAPVFQVGTQLRRWIVQPYYARGDQDTKEATLARHTRLVRALAKHPDEVVVSLGTNDGGDYHPLTGHESRATLSMIAANDAIIRRNVREMVGLVRSHGAQLTWALPLDTTTDHDKVDRAREVIRSELADIQRQIDADTQARGAPPYRINVVDISRTPIPMDNGLHANADGYAAWGAAVWKSYTPTPAE